MTIQIRFFRVVSPALTLLALGAPALGALDRDRVPVGSVPAGISSAKRLGPAEAQLPVERVLISLRQRNPEALARFLEAQQDPASPQFHRWLTPEEFGDRFGAAREDVEALTGWLAEQGLVVESVSKGRIAVAVSGTVERMEAAFGTKLAAYAAADRLVLANEEPPTLPSRFARSVSGVVSLHGFTKRKPLLHESPLYTNGTGRYSLAPADLHVIYGFTSLLTKGIDGAGTKIAVPSRSNVNPEAFRAFRAAFALPANDPVVLLNGPDPGILSGAEEGFAQEAALDVEWCGAAAPKATIVFVLAASTSTADGIDLASLYAVDQNAADVVELSYGFCELDKDGGPEATAFYHAIWAQAAAQGMSVVVASGDSGAAGCDLGSATGTIASVNGLGSSPYATCVGGTTFAEGGTPSAYWDATNDAGTGRSAKSYIPEIVWNESSLNGGRGLLATGGGVSAIFSKPSWQSGPGVPNDAVRDVPDVAMNAASHTPYLTFYGRTTPFQTAFYGTSASAPPFAGLAALLVQKAGGRVGTLNPALYAIARGAASGSSPFHDVTMGNNTVTGVPGFPATAGFDLSTGLGSPDAGKLASAFTAPPAAPDFEIIASPGSFGLLPGQSRDVSVRLEGAAGDVTAFLSLDGVPAGLTASFSPSPVSAAGGKGVASNGFPATLTLRASNSASPGIYTIAISATAGAATRSTVLVLSIGTTTPPVTSGVEVQIPVVLDVHGAGTSHFT
ncbi:MAG TPA: S53 family peptidase [Thermoanaerobaculia bacterium]|nr:S53 family peptidase [Thermoanaerobaculia bacterium]